MIKITECNSIPIYLPANFKAQRQITMSAQVNKRNKIPIKNEARKCM
jgi:hypothetical protein